MDRTEARRRWAGAQGLGERSTGSLTQVVEATGWIRTLGGAEAYLALAARSPNVTVEAVNALVASGAMSVVPAVRGCIYLVPAAHVPLALRLSRALAGRRFARDLDKVGSSLEEMAEVGAGVLEALSGGPLSTSGLRSALPAGLNRSFGAVGKKVGLSSTLPPALRQLEWEGRLRRVPAEDRLDHERYLWVPASGLGPGPEGEALHTAMAELYFRWAGPSTLTEFASWTGLGKTAARKAIAAAELDEVDVDGIGAAYLVNGSVPATSSRTSLLPALDNLWAMGGGGPWLVDPDDAHHEISHFGRPAIQALGKARQPLERTISRDGRVVGLWAYDPAQDELVVRSFGDSTPPEEALRAAAAVFAALGHGRYFSIDSEERVQARADRVRG